MRCSVSFAGKHWMLWTPTFILLGTSTALPRRDQSLCRSGRVHHYRRGAEDDCNQLHRRHSHHHQAQRRGPH